MGVWGGNWGLWSCPRMATRNGWSLTYDQGKLGSWFLRCRSIARRPGKFSGDCSTNPASGRLGQQIPRAG